jgi:hypothetical protein
VTGGKPIAVFLQSNSGVSAINPLVAFYDIHGGKREVLFFYFVPEPQETKSNCWKKVLGEKSKNVEIEVYLYIWICYQLCHLEQIEIGASSRSNLGLRSGIRGLNFGNTYYSRFTPKG